MPEQHGAESPSELFLNWREQSDGDTASVLDALRLRYPEHAGAFDELQRTLARVEALMDGSAQAEPPAATADLRGRLAAHRRAAQPLEEKGLLGEGGMGRVLEVFDGDLRRGLAMKVLRTDREQDPALRRELENRFFQEAQVTAQLDHPGIPPIHELGLLPDGRAFYTMPKLPKRTLEDVFQLGRTQDPAWTRERCLELLVRVLETLAFAHSRGVVHRDVKPANVIVGDFGAVLVIDWGLARVVGTLPTTDAVWSDRLDELRRNFGEGFVFTSPQGTPGYMAPEQTGFDSSLQDARTDVYAVGAMVYRLLSGVTPHADSLQALRQRGGGIEELAEVLEQRPRGLTELAPDAPPELIAIAERAMEPKREGRYPNAESMAEDLRRYLELRPVLAYRTGPWVEFSKWVRRNRAVAALLGALFLGALIASSGGFYLERGRAQALATRQDRERNLTGAVLLDSVLERSARVWTAPMQLPLLGAIERDAEFLLARAVDLPRRIAALEVERARRSAGAEAEDLDVQIAQLRLQSERLPDLEVARTAAGDLRATIEQRLRHRPTAADWEAAWERAHAALHEDTRFAGAELPRQVDLLPLGPAEPAGLWAFLHLETADFSTPLIFQNADEVGPERGLVLLLLPGGEVSLGAVPPTSAEEIELPHRDLYAYDRDSERALAGHDPIPRTVELAPYYLGRYEVTRGEWQRLMNETRFSSPAAEGSHPMMQPAVMLDRADASAFAARLGCNLPTEAQWEAAYRSGTTSPCFVPLEFVQTEVGHDYDWQPLADYANVLDRAGLAAELQGASRLDYPTVYAAGEPDDGFVHAAPVGSFLPNPYGLFDMAGNVWEWCTEDYVRGWGPLRAGDGLQLQPGDPNGGVLRGGSWYAPAPQARAAIRIDGQPGTPHWDVGLRVCRVGVPSKP